MFKNVAGQYVTLIAVDTSTGQMKSGESANITPYVSLDGGATTAIAAPVVTELSALNDRGSYRITLSQSETNADMLHFSGRCSTANVDIIPKDIYTVRKVNGVHAADVLEQILARAAERTARLAEGPSTNTETITRIRYDAYLDSDGRAYSLTVADWTGGDVSSWTVAMRICTQASFESGGVATASISGSISQPSTDAIVVVEMAATDTSALAAGLYHYQVLLTNGVDVITPAKGVLIVEERVPPIA